MPRYRPQSNREKTLKKRLEELGLKEDYDIFVQMVARGIRTASLIHFVRKSDGSEYSWPTVNSWRILCLKELKAKAGNGR